ncbi:MAG TPA: transcription antitermination protein NusB [Oscillatoriales cyanobacterium M59_W2019_021]|nr:transcription antitermination protein NusB [Oscillatoriales cyanobacterium M4454_W2019_049]HIK53037.1 transcription antitermination protein NusB [Oscillatoriales cyanobacterium M59_W2019_021]
MQARRISRELALLSLSQLPNKAEKLSQQSLKDIVLAAVRTMTAEAHDILETAAAELTRGNDRLLNSETRTTELNSARAMVKEALDLAQSAINRLGMAIELPEFIYLSNQKEVQAYALEILTQVASNRPKIDELLTEAIVDWHLPRLPRIDRDILRIAVAEMWFLGLPDRVAINEAVELAKRYSTDDAHRFINGVLRRVTESIA